MKLTNHPIRADTKAPNSNRLDAALFGIGALAIACIFLVQAARLWDFTVDDAYITLRQARNLARGYGFVYNIGGPRVESYTSHLHFLLEWAAILCGLDALQTTKILGCIAGLAVLGGSVVLARDMLRWSGFDSSQISAAVFLTGPAMLLCSPMLLFASISGLETSLFVALITWGVWAAMKSAVEGATLGRTVAGGIFLGLATWTRPEGIAWVAGLTLGSAYMAKTSHRRILPALAPVGIALAFWVILIAWRLAIFGHIHPNTYYAKIGKPLAERFLAGLGYSRRWLVNNGGIFMILAALFGTISQKPSVRAPTLAALLLVVGQLFLVVYEGEDWMPHLRMLTPMLGILAALCSVGVAMAVAKFLKRARFVVSILVALIIPGLLYAGVHKDRDNAFTYGQTRMRGWRTAHIPLGNWLADWNKQREKSGAQPLTVAISDIGLIGWASDVRIIDLAGLADPDWAATVYRDKKLAVYPVHNFLEKYRPEVIVLVTFTKSEGDLDIPWQSEHYIYVNDEFQHDYSAQATYTHYDLLNAGYFLHVFVRNDVRTQAPPIRSPMARMAGR